MNQNINDIFYISNYNIEVFDIYYKAKTQYMMFNIIKIIKFKLINFIQNSSFAFIFQKIILICVKRQIIKDIYR
jgi:hypothetical protein